MSVKKPSTKPVKGKKTVSAKAAKAAPKVAAKPAPKPVAKEKAALPRSASTAKPAPTSGATPIKVVPPRVPSTPAVDTTRTEESEYEMNASLLSGPRNVQPYQVRKGEEYMSKEQLDHFRTILAIWKRDLMQEVDRTVLHMKDEAANFPDPNDRATQESEFSLELRTRDRERKLIRKIDEALKRIEDGSYGYCLETGEPIGVKRLEARPVATLSVEAQERRERREKQFGDRDDWYR
jgi:DnaK suppressor protein